MSKKEKVAEPQWEVKDRVYLLAGEKTPLTLTIPSKNYKIALMKFYKKPTSKLKKKEIEC